MKISRLFEMIFLLMNHKSMSAQQLAEYFEVSTRTIYRDVDILSMAGIPIYAQKGRNGGISLMEHYVLNKSLVSKEEQQQILTSLKSLSFTSDHDMDQTLKKLTSFFNVDEENWLDIDYQNWSNANEKIELSIFKQAILNCKHLSFDYYDRYGKKKLRVVEPYKVLYKGSDWYVLSFCTIANDFRYFKISRMQNVKLLSTSFDKRTLPKNNEKHYERKETEIVIKVDKKWAYRVLDEMRNTIIEENENNFLVKIVMDDAWLYSYIFSYLDMIEVVEPLEVKEKVKEIANNIINKYKI